MSRLAFSIAIALLLLALPAAAVQVDDFSTDQAAINAPPDSSSNAVGAGILGNNRGLDLDHVSGRGGGSTASVSTGELHVELATGDRGRLRVIWDGDTDPDVVDPVGLGGADLTAGGARALRIAVTTASEPFDLVATVFTDATSFSIAARRVSLAGDVVFDFATDFIARGGVGGADFTNVGAIVLELVVDGPQEPPPTGTVPEGVMPGGLANFDFDIVETIGPAVSNATKDALDVTGTSDVDPATPGQTLTYRIEVAGGDTAIEGVSVADTLDSNLTVVANSLTTRPFAVRDTYTAVGNVQLVVAAAGVLANDRDVDDAAGPSSLAVTAFDATSAAGGPVAVAADGSFTYTSPPGFEGIDTFSYTVTDDEGQTDDATVTVVVESIIWFVDNTVAPGGAGTSDDPFHALASAELASSDGHIIRVRRGDGTDTNHDVGIDLKPRQKLIGAGVALVVGGIVLEPSDPLGPPIISHTDHVVDLADEVEVRGVAIEANAVAAEHGIRGIGVSGQIQISDVAVTGNGNHGGILLTASPSADVSLTDVELTAGDDPALLVTNVQSVAVAGACDFSSAGTVMDIDATTLTGTVQSLTGARAQFDGIGPASSFAVATTTTLTDPPGTGLLVQNSPGVNLAFGTTSVTDTAIGAGNTATAVDLGTGNAGATIAFTSLAVVADGGTGLRTGAGTVDVGAATSSIAATGGPAIDADGTTLQANAASGWTLANVTSTNSTGRGLRLANTAGPVTVTGPTMVTGAAGRAIELSNAAATTFTGQLVAASTAAVGLFASSSGPVTVADGTSTVSATGASAISMTSTNIGAGGMTFAAVMASATGTAPGAVFDNVDAGTFTSNGTTIAGTGAGQHGIHITGSAAGFAFSGTTAVDDTGGDGIRLEGANGAIAFNSVAIDDTAGNGVTVSGNVATVNIGGGTIGETVGSGTTTAGNAVDVDGGVANVTLAAAIRNTAARAVEITGRAMGIVEVSGAINDTGTGINVATNTGGISRFSNASKVINTGANQAVTLATNGGHSIEFTGGGLDIDTTTVTAFDASGGGTVIVTRNAGPGNSVATTTGTAVRIAGVTIGAGHVEWQRVDSTTASANTAIVLDGTGAGELRVTGTGTTAGSGGTISNKTTDAVTLRTTGGLVHLRNMVLEDIGNMAGGLDTISGHDAIHGEAVGGGLRVEGTRISRISDNAIHGEPFAGPGTTSFVGLDILTTTIEDTNRYHVANIGDDNNEAMVRIRGLSGTVRVLDSTLRRGAELLDLNSATAGSISMTVQRSIFADSFKGITSPSAQAAGLACINVKMEQAANAVIHIGDPLETDPAEGNSFTNCATIAIGIKHLDELYSGNTDTIISRNTLVTNYAPGGPPNPFGFGNIPGTGILLRPQGTSAATLDAIVSHNSLTRSGLAEGEEGAITVLLDSANSVISGTSQVRVSDNTITTPVAAPIFVLAENNTAARVLLSNNTIVPGVVNLPDFGPSELPGNSSKVRTRQGGKLDVTVENHFFPQQDTVFVEGGESFKARTLGGGPVTDDLCLSMRCPNFPGACGAAINNTSDRGYELRNDAGTLRLHQGASASTVPQTILQENNNRGGLTAAVKDPNKNPPDVDVIGVITATSVACAVPGGAITGGTF